MWKIPEKNPTFWLGMVVLTSNPSYSRGGDWKDHSPRPALDKNVGPYPKKKKIKTQKGWGMPQVVESRPSKYEALSSNPSITKNPL
jgi:hypothetical protein